MIFFSLIVFGAVSLGRLGVSYMPDIDFPVLAVTVNWEGVPPQYMESEVVDRLERAIISVEGLKEIRSNVRQGTATISLEFQIDRNIDAALQEVQSAISRVRLPTGIDPPIIRKSNPDDSPILWIGLSSKIRTVRDLYVIADQSILDRLQLLDGVGEVFAGGTIDRNLRIWIDLNRLKKFELTIVDVLDAIASEHSEGASGYLENSEFEKNLRVLGEASTVQQIEDIRITRRGGRPIYYSDIRIRDIARVEDGLSDTRRITRLNGVEGISLGIRKQRGANAVAVGNLVRKEIDRLKTDLPEDIELQVNFDSTVFVEEAVNETLFTLVLSAVLTSLVCWLFLGNWSSTLNVILSIPGSILGSFLILYFMGFTLNLFTLLALSLAIGIVVDDNIMILENIIRHFDMGKDRVKAAKEGTREIAFAAVASSTAIMAIFLPVAFMEGVIGRYFWQLGITLSAAVALSLLDAVTLTPMRASQLLVRSNRDLRIVKGVRITMEWLTALYRRQLEFALHRPVVILAGSTAVFALSLSLIYFIRMEFVPPQDQSQFGIQLQTPVGSSLAHTITRLEEVEQYLKKRPEVERFLAIAGGFQGGESNRVTIFVTLKPESDRKLSQQQIMAEVRRDLSGIRGVRAFLFDLSTRGLTARRSQPVEFSIRGAEWSTLKENAEKIIARMNETGLYRDIDTDYREGMPEVQIIPDRKAASLRGVSMQTLVQTIGASLGGIRAGRFSSDGRRYDIRLRLKPDQWKSEADVARISVRNVHGQLVSLSDVASVVVSPTVQTLTRVDRQRSIQITANLAEKASQAEALSTAERISRENLPHGYFYYQSGGSSSFQEAFSGIYTALWMGVLVAYMVLGAQFNSFLHPLIVLLALPFSITGALFVLFITDNSLNLYSMIGLILLTGIVKKNSIMLVEFTNELITKKGLDVKSALMEAGTIRLRPIVMTSLSTIAAAIPPALAIGPGAESRIPLALTVIGGLTVSTAFTLFVVPAAFTLFSRSARHTRQG
jgi:HAE1 family hydrophobic/amphiphilic exporter-1